MKTFLHLLPLFLLSLSAEAGEILGGRFYTAQKTLYVNQAFELRLELTVTFGSELEDLRIGGLPQGAESWWEGKWEPLWQTRKEQEGKSVTVYTFRVPSRCSSPFRLTFQPVINCTLVERRSAGFFSQWQSYPKQKRLDPFSLHVLPLPAGQPASFSGAVGKFSLTGSLSTKNVRPGDIVTLSLDLKGTGWLGNAPMPAPAADARFKTYPVKETLREPLHITTRQVWIPSGTNAVSIGKATFTFFNPDSGRYETVAAGPFPLAFTEASAKVTNDVVRVIRTDTADPVAAGPATAVTLERMNASFRHFRPMIVLVAFLLIAFFVFFALFGTHTRLAFVLAAVLLLCGGIAAVRLSRQKGADGMILQEKTEVRFAPSRQATILFTLAPGVTVTPLESASPWTRIDSEGHRGWILHTPSR